MAATPTIKELYNSIKSNLESELGITIPVFGKVFLNALAAVQAAKLKLYWIAIAKVQKNIFLDTADPEANGGTLERFCRVKLGRERFAATQGVYTVEATGTISSVISANTVFKANDDSTAPGKRYVVDADVTLDVSPKQFQVRALEAGLDSQLQPSDTLTSTIPLLNIDDQVDVISEDTEPLVAEEIEDYRQKGLAAFQTEAQGGSAGDYRIWSGDAQGVAQVYPYTKSGECAEIDLYVEATKADSTDGLGTPTAQILSDVEDVVELDPDSTLPLNERGRRPLGVFQINYLAVSVKPVVIDIVNESNIDNDTKDAIEAAVEAEIDSIRPFVESAEPLDQKNNILNVNKIIAVIQGVLSGNQSFDSLTLEVDSVAISNSTIFSDGDIPYLDSITYS